VIRITSGSAKNKRLKLPRIEGFHSVQEVAKLALFSIIGNEIEKSTCLDLFSGSGNIGIEALSRGAAWCDFVDENKLATDVIEKNLAKCGFTERAEVHRNSSVSFVANTGKYYDFIFVDPFYKDVSHIFLMENIEESLNKGGLVAFFHSENLKPEDIIKKTTLHIKTQRRFGKSHFTIIT